MNHLIDDEVLVRFLETIGALITESHVVNRNQKHSSAYINKDAIYPQTIATYSLCQKIGFEFMSLNVEVVIAPATSSIILSQLVADYMTKMTGRQILAVFAEKSTDGFVVKRGYDKLIAGKRVLIVKDVLTTGLSTKKVLEVVRELGGDVVGVGTLCNCGGVRIENLGNPPKLFSVFDISIEMWEEKDCPLCKKGVPVNTTIGKGTEFLLRKEFVRKHMQQMP